MYKFKKLEWSPQEGVEGLCAKPNGLKWHYSIIFNRNHQVEFALLDNNYEYESGFPQICTSVIDAIELANKHYISLLEKFISD